ncbi:ribonuclease H-like domain-containing protein [Rhizophagus clarus]|uniref:Ribonuclease H-like domain-containing protein n=1 Tax=Rhizophagus clarus TaxID=94130 RepID=A0A8H3QXZ8_9GLOM|nr:ribonuclease H-like domain-containing protein [Rhizophagus clarus]
MFNFRNSNIQNFQQKLTPASTSRDVGQFHTNDAEFSHDSYENTNDICLDTSIGNQRRPSELKTKSGNGSTGHYRAKCYYCSNEWVKGKPIKLETYLGFECAKCPENIREYWVAKAIDKQNNYQQTSVTKKRKVYSMQTNITGHFKNDEPLPIAKQNSLDQAVLKAWIAAGVPFSVIKNPFIIDLFMRLNSKYVPPSRTTLSGRILMEEANKTKTKINKIFEQSENLTLSIDRWTSLTHNSIYNYIVTTPDRQKFLLELKDYSQGSTTGDFLADQISSIVEKTGVEKFAAFVTDSGSNCRRARELIERTYPHVIDMRCAAHAINLIAADFSKNSIVASFISELNKVIEFFNRSHAANKELEEGLRNMKISGGRLQTYVKTRWGSLFNSVNSILHARPVFDWIIREEPEIITSIQVKNQLKNNEFFSIGQTVARIMEPIKDCILKLEARTATLADYYIQMLKLAATINRIPSSNTLRSAIIGIYNHRYQEFDYEVYLLSYYLYPSYRGYGLNNKAFQIACHVAAKYGQALGYGENMSHHLLTQLKQFK